MERGCPGNEAWREMCAACRPLRRARRGGAGLRNGRKLAGDCRVGGDVAGMGELAGPPEFDQVFQTIEQAGKGGQDEDMQGRHDPSLGGVLLGRGAHVGGDACDVLRQGMC